MEQTKKKRFREKIGMFYRIPLDNNQFGYGQVVTKTKHIFFDHMDIDENWTDPAIILEKPVVFYTTVDWYVLKDGLWEILGIYPVKTEHQIFPASFSYDIVAKSYGFNVDNKGFVPCKLEEIEGRECLASWPHKSIEQRLRDYFAGRPNYEVTKQKSRLTYYQPGNPATYDLPKFPTRHEFYRQYGYEFPYTTEKKEKV